MCIRDRYESKCSNSLGAGCHYWHSGCWVPFLAQWVPDSGANWVPGAGAGENWVLGAITGTVGAGCHYWHNGCQILVETGCWVPVLVETGCQILVQTGCQILVQSLDSLY